jgi:hypothetical protein
MVNVYRKVASGWEDENGHSLSTAHLDAVAELCHEVGVSVAMDYGVCESGAYVGEWWFTNLRGSLSDHFRYSTDAAYIGRGGYNSFQWFDRLKAQFNLNRPVPYTVERHALVADGWEQQGLNPNALPCPLMRFVHFNYGWGGRACTTTEGCNTWYCVDNVYLGGASVENMIENVYPAACLGSTLSPTTYLPMHRYFDRDCAPIAGASSKFAPGSKLQFLPGVTVHCDTYVPSLITFQALNLLFTRGDPSKGIATSPGGQIVVHPGGGIRFPK